MDPKAKRKKQDIIRRRNDILSAVERLGEKEDFISFDKLNLDEIALEAGLTKPTLYRYFKSKEDLMIGFAAYSYRKVSDFMGIQLEINKSTTVPKRLEAISKAYYHFAIEHPAILKILNDLGRENQYLILKEKISNESSTNSSKYIVQQRKSKKISKKPSPKKPLSLSQKDYIHEYEGFRNTLLNALSKDEFPSKILPDSEIELRDFVEILAIIINGVITELQNRNKVLQERGLTDEKVLSIIMALLGKGILE